MNDEQLLRLAAKAAGIALVHKPFLHNGRPGAALTADGYWNPLTDDGDRYRLAKKLDIRIHFGPAYVTYEAGGLCGVVRWPEDEPDDARAIVRAAAAIGEKL